MKTTIGPAGRLVIPKQAGRIEIEPASLPVKLVRKGRLLVAVPEKDVATFGADTVERIRQTLRRERSPRT